MLRSAFIVILVLVVASTVPCQETLRASQLLKMEIRGPANEALGDVRDVVLDGRTGGVSFAIVSFNRLSAFNGKLFAIPWQALTPAADGKSLRLSISRTALAQVPGFDPNKWPDLSDPSYAESVTTAWGLGERARFTDPDGERVIGARETVALPPSAARATRTTAVVTGTVKEMYPSELSEVVIETDYGDLEAVLAPISYLDERQLAFDENVNVTLRGRSAYVGGRLVFVALEAMTHPGRWVALRRDDLTPLWTVVVEAPWEVRYLSGTVEGGWAGFATILVPDEGLRTVSIAPSNYFESRHWRLRPGKLITITGYDDPDTRQFVAITVDHENETWRVRRDDGTPLWRER
jgi:sporulation protein YlmC with PRC-barrel domain